MATGSSKATSPNTELGEDDLGALYKALYPARNSYRSLGLLIGVKIGEIESIESNKTDPGDRLLAILSVRLNKAEPLTWNEIDSALRSECVDKSRLADKLRQKYGHLFVPESSTESESEQEHEIKSEEIKRVKKRAPKKQKGGDHRARVSKEQERSSEYEGTETVRSKKHVQEVESEDEEDAVLSRKEKKEKVRRKGAHDKYKQVHDKERPKGKNKKEKFMKDESQSEPEEVVREKSKRKKKATHDKQESVKGYGDRDHYSDTEVCEKVRKRSKKHSKKREVYTESESEASSDEDEMSFEDDTSHKGSARRKLTKIHPQKEQRKDGKKKDAKSRDNRYSDEEVSTKSAQKLRKSKKVETESEEESSFASSSDEEEIEVHKRTKKSKHTETKSAARTKDTVHYESEEKGKTSGKKRVSLKPKSATAKEASPCPEEYKDKGRKKAVRVDERVGKSTDSSRETYHKTRSKPPRKETEGRDGKREVVSGKKAKRATAPPLERELPSSEMAQTDSGDGESDESSEDENESEQQSSDEEEETENDDLSTAEENEEKRSEICKEKATHPTTEMRKTKSQDDENPRSVKGKKSSKAAGAPSKDDSHGDKEESDAGGSRDQEDQPKKRNRKRHRESSKSPIVRGGSSPSSSQEERKPGSRGKKRNKRGREHKKKSDRKKKGKGDKDGASGIDDSSPECDMKNQSEVETKELASVFECFFGTLCRVPFNPEEIAAQLQKKGLISIPVMKEMIISPESQQAKIISLIDALDKMIKSHPERLFSCIEVMLKNDVLQEPGKQMLSEAGKTNHFLYRALVIYTFFFSAKVCPAVAAAKFPSQVSPSDLAVVVSPDVVGMQTVTICVVTVVCLLCSTFILQRVRGRHKKQCPAQPQKALHSLCLHLVQVQVMLHHLRQ